MESSFSSARWVLLLLVVLGCSRAAPPASGRITPLSPSAALSVEIGPAASAEPVASSAAAPQPPPVDPCALPPPRVVVPKAEKKRSPSAFDVGPDGRLSWIIQDAMTKEAEIFALALDAGAQPQRVREVKMSLSVGAMVVGRDGYWLSTDDMSKGVCGGRVVWLGRDAPKAVPVSEIGCLSGPVRAPGAEALWGVRKSYTHPMDPVVARGAPPGGLSPMPRGFDGDVELIATTGEDVYFAFDDGGVKRRSPEGKMEDVYLPLSPSATMYSRGLAVHGDHLYLLSGPSRGGLDLLRMPRKGGHGKRDKITSFDVKDAAPRLYATDGGVVVELSLKDRRKQLLLVDPRGVCPHAELPPPDLSGNVVVEGGVVYTLRDGGITASSLGARASTAAGH